MKIHKVRTGGMTTLIEWSKKAANGQNNLISLKSADLPAKPFFDALEELVPFVIDMLDFPKDYKKNLTVVGVTFKYKDEQMGVVITAKKTLASGRTMGMNTPLMYAAADGVEKGTKFLLVKCVEALTEVSEQAKKFVNGERAQLGMFDAPEEGKAA